MMEKCECPARSDDARVYHGGQDECPREAADYLGMMTSPALCTACLFGCADEFPVGARERL